MSTDKIRSPQQIAAIEFAVSRLEHRIIARWPEADIHRAIVAAAIELVAEPEGEPAAIPDCDCLACVLKRAAAPEGQGALPADLRSEMPYSGWAVRS